MHRNFKGRSVSEATLCFQTILCVQYADDTNQKQAYGNI